MARGEVMATTHYSTCCKWHMEGPGIFWFSFFIIIIIFETELNKTCLAVQATEMLECSLKNDRTSACYFAMGLLLTLRSCPPYLPGGMFFWVTATCGCFAAFLCFTAANSSFTSARWLGGSLLGHWNRRTAFRASPFLCRGIGRAEDVA